MVDELGGSQRFGSEAVIKQPSIILLALSLECRFTANILSYSSSPPLSIVDLFSL